MNHNLNIAEYIQTYASLIEKELPRYIPEHWNIPKTLRQAMEYSLLGGGKRIRPILVLAAAEAVGGQTDPAVPVACAVEMIHTYSLIHDDLPAMDNDDYRRGRPTNHKVFGEAMAILAGDALLTHAFYTLVQAYRKFGVGADEILHIVEELAEYGGARGLVGGQAADIEGEQGKTTLEELEYIHRHKTGDLIVFSLRAGARIAGANQRQLEALAQFGANIGLAFQIQDDVLDIIGQEEKLGKSPKSDEKKHKVTYPYFIGVDESIEQVRKLTEDAKKAIEQGGFLYPDRLLELADYLMRRDH